MERKQALLPVCSGTLGLCCAALQLVAIATPYWAEFSSDDPLGSNIINNQDKGPSEKGHYGLWTLCLSISTGIEYEHERCDGNVKSYVNPGKIRFISGACAVANLVLILVFLAPVPAQLLFVLKDKGIVPLAYRAITMIKIVTSCMGGASAIAAATTINFTNKNQFFQENKGWSFGIQIVVIVLEAFLVICSSAEHMVGKQYPKGPLTKCRHVKTERALTNLGFSEKTPDIDSRRIARTPPPSPMNDTVLEKIKTDRELNGRPVTVSHSFMQYDEDETKNEAEDLPVEVKKRPNKKGYEKPERQDSENSTGMQYHNLEFQASNESIESSPNCGRNDKQKSYYYGHSMDETAPDSLTPKFSLSNSNVSTLTARSTDV